MGKIRETFRLVAEESASAEQRCEVEPDVAAPAAEAHAEEMPYIEIGPRRQVEGSPDVMACPAGPRKPQEPPPSQEVQFRMLPASGLRLAEVPRRSRFAPELVAYHAPEQAAASRYGGLLNTVLDAARDRGVAPANVYFFSAIRPGIGATTVLLNLAITAARRDSRVLVVDANLRRPAVAARVGLETSPGLTDVLTGAVSLADAVRSTALDNLSVLSAGSPAAVWADRLRELLTELAGEADYVFLDGPPWEGRGAASALAANSGAAFLVAPASEADKTPTSDLVTMLPVQGIPLAGCILTAG